jgi:hypothetical protein
VGDDPDEDVVLVGLVVVEVAGAVVDEIGAVLLCCCEPRGS